MCTFLSYVSINEFRQLRLITSTGYMLVVFTSDKPALVSVQPAQNQQNPGYLLVTSAGWLAVHIQYRPTVVRERSLGALRDVGTARRILIISEMIRKGKGLIRVKYWSTAGS